MEDVSIDGSVTVDSMPVLDCSCTVHPKIIVLNTKRPYVLNSSNIECIIGEWNKDKGEYGVRVYFVSGNNHWFGGNTAKSLLWDFAGQNYREDAETVKRRFDERVKAGPPSV